jgi:hypothetical protein
MLKSIDSIQVNIQHPIEIIVKKIFYRADDFMARDFYDLATVYSYYKDNLIKYCLNFMAKIELLSKRLVLVENSKNFIKSFSTNNILQDTKSVVMNELPICKDFIAKILTQ